MQLHRSEFGDWPIISNSAQYSSDEDLAFSKVAAEVQHWKKRYQVSVPEVVKPVNETSSKKPTKEIAATK